jgi:hypothetical protein
MRIACCAAAAGLALAAAAAPADDKAEAKGKDVDYQVHSGYFERNDSGLKGDASYLALADQKAFDAVFGVGRVVGGKQNFLPKDALDAKVVAAVVKRGKSVVEYKVEKVLADGETLYVQYTTADKGGRRHGDVRVAADRVGGQGQVHVGGVHRERPEGRHGRGRQVTAGPG